MAKKRRRRKARSSTVRRRKRRASASKTVRRKRRRRSVARAAAPKRRRRRRKVAAAAPKRRRRRKSRRVSSRRRRRSTRRRYSARGHRVTLTVNPRRRRRRRKAHGRRRRSYRRNPGRAMLGGLVGALKQAVPFAAGLFVSRLASKNVDKIPGVNMLTGKLGQHSQPVMSVLLVLAAHFLTKKVRPLQRYRTAIMVGAGINAVETVLRTYLPSVAGMVGAGDQQELGAYPMQGLGEYIDVEDYVDTGEYIDVDDYEEMGDFEEMGTEYELGDSASALQIGTGIGSAKFLKPLPNVSMVGPVKNVPMVAQVPAWAPASEAGLYTGIFAKKTLPWGGYRG